MKRNIKLLSIASLACVLFSQTDIYAQQDPGYTQYMYNTSLINPAYAGSRGVMSVFGQYRTQWVGLDGAPQTAALSINTPIGDSKVGIGLSFVNDRIGATTDNSIQIDLSYTVDLSETYKLAVGLKGTADILNVDYTKLDRFNPEDSQFLNNIDNKFSPNIGAGLYLYSDKSYFGFSVPSFLTQDRTNEEDLVMMKQKMNFYLMGGYVFKLSENVDFKPAFLAKGVSGAPFEVDLSANFQIYEKFTAGLAYRFDSSVSALVGFQATKSLFIGYSYDATTTKLSYYNSGSHEIFLRFDLFDTLKKFNSPRFF